ncbi:MAG: hypothetical protein V1799_17550 [bacterium]
MNAIDFFNSGELELPKSRDTNAIAFDQYLQGIFNNYLATLRKVDSPDYVSVQLKANVHTAATLCKDIQEVLQLQFSGFPSKAFEKLKSTLVSVDSHVKALLSSPDISNTISHLYRMRVAGSNPLSRNQIFHIPFELRHLVNTQRYSIPGLPCLYFGGSTYVCWEELDRPALHTVHIARFKPVDSVTVRVLDFGYRPAEIAGYLDHEQANTTSDNVKSRFIIAQGLCWPLLAACSIRVKFREAPFKPEYVVPQLILQWVTESTDCDGVRFFSTRIQHYVGFPMPVCNFAFPSRTAAATGFCTNLTSKFELSEPLYWQMAKESALRAEHPPNMHFKLKLAEGAEVDYINTEFGMMQFYLAPLPCRKI